MRPGPKGPVSERAIVRTRTQRGASPDNALSLGETAYNGSVIEGAKGRMMKQLAKTHKPTTKDLEKKYAATAFTLNQERNDFFLPQVQDFVRQKKWMNLRPEYQRRQVWDDERRSLFIESLLLNVPVPPVFLYEWDLSRYEVMDGQQRLNSIVDFYDNLFPLRGLEKWSELNGSRYKELPDTLQRGLDRRRISATVLLVGGSVARGGPEKSDIRKLVFERLNTGGLRLNNQELRNCLYEGPFNDLLITLSRNTTFTKIWDIPPYDEHVDRNGNVSSELRDNPLYKRMVDCELVLRFFAFRKRSNIRGSIRSMLDRCMEEHLTATNAEIEALHKDFADRISLARNVFGANAFHFEDEAGQSHISQTLYDGVMVALDRLSIHQSKIVAAKSAVVQKVSRLLRNGDAFEVIIGKPNTAKAVLKRMDLITKAIESAI